MTTLPKSFDYRAPDQSYPPVLMFPKVLERYWGYEIDMNEVDLDLTVLARGTACLVIVGMVDAAIGIWAVPAMVLAGAAPMAKLVVSLMLLAVASAMFLYAGRSTRVRVQVDTANGELREVGAGPFGSVVTLASYGFDTVKAVRVVASNSDPSIGQLQIDLKGGVVVPAGDGTLIALRHLRDRMAADCCAEPSGVMRHGVYASPRTR